MIVVSNPLLKINTYVESGHIIAKISCMYQHWWPKWITRKSRHSCGGEITLLSSKIRWSTSWTKREHEITKKPLDKRSTKSFLTGSVNFIPKSLKFLSWSRNNVINEALWTLRLKCNGRANSLFQMSSQRWNQITN